MDVLVWIDTAFNGGLVLPQKRITELGLMKESTTEALLADGREYLVQSGYTLADGYLFTISGWSSKFGHDLSRFPNITALRARVAARPAVQAAMRAEGMV